MSQTVIHIFIMAKQKSKEHAEHIESASVYLDSSNQYPDWVITTCFYSSLHYLRHKVFPFSIVLGKKIPNYKVECFEDFHTFQTRNGKKLGRHERFRCLVEEKCPINVASGYGRLLELSYGARYSDYNYDEIFVREAQKCLAEIKTHCVPSVTATAKIVKPAKK